MMCGDRAVCPATILLLVVLPMCGCGSERAAAPVGVAGGGAAAEGDGPGPLEPRFQCSGDGFAGGPAPQPFEFLDAVIVDLDGNPIPALRAQACGINVCLNAETGVDGAVTIDTVAQIDRAAFKYGLGRSYAKFAYLLPNEPVHHLGTHTTAALPDPATGVPLEPGTRPSSNGVMLSLPTEMNELRIDPFDFDTDALRGFRAVRVPIEQAPPAVDPALGLELLYALTPVGTELCPRAALSVPNDAGWPPGTAVEFHLHGVEITEKWAPYGGWAKISDGRVSDDGTTITTHPDGGIPILSVVGVRRGG